MTQIEEIQSRISKLPGPDVRRLREWLEEYEAQLWDEQIDTDAKAGRLDALADEAIRRFKSGQTKPL